MNALSIMIIIIIMITVIIIIIITTMIIISCNVSEHLSERMIKNWRI